MGLSRTVSEIKGDFGQKLHFFLLPRVFNSPADGFPLEFCNAGENQKTRVMRLPDGPKNLRYAYYTRDALHSAVGLCRRGVSVCPFFTRQYCV